MTRRSTNTSTDPIARVPFVILVAVLGTLVVLVLASCTLTSNVSGVSQAWSVIAPDYVQYVMSDEGLDEDEKQLRLETAELMSQAIREVME